MAYILIITNEFQFVKETLFYFQIFDNNLSSYYNNQYIRENREIISGHILPLSYMKDPILMNLSGIHLNKVSKTKIQRKPCIS